MINLNENPEENRKIIEQMKKQREIDALADIEYDCFVSKITEKEFWGKWLG